MNPSNHDRARVIVTAGGSGIGRIIAERFAQLGSEVLCCDVDPERVALLDAGVPSIVTAVADVSRSEDVDRLFRLADAQMGGVDVLVNNAGIAGPVAYVEEVPLEDWRRTLDVNLTGAFLCAQRVAPILKQQHSGCIINMSSQYGLFGGPTRSPYVASKWGLIGLTKTLAMELGPFGIRVNAVCPGAVEGERLERVLREEAFKKGTTRDDLREEWVRGCSLRTFVTPEDVAATVLFLASRGGAHISGQALAVDGHTEWV